MAQPFAFGFDYDGNPLRVSASNTTTTTTTYGGTFTSNSTTTLSSGGTVTLSVDPITDSAGSVLVTDAGGTASWQDPYDLYGEYTVSTRREEKYHMSRHIFE